MRRKIGLAVFALGAVTLTALVLAIPYILYIAFAYGWSDDRITWVPFGAIAGMVAVVLIEIGFHLAKPR